MNRNQTANNQSHPGSCCFHLTKNNDTHQEIFHPIENQSKTIKLHFNAIKSIQFHHRIFHGLESSKNICPKCPRSRSRLVSTSPKKATSGLRFLPWHNMSFWFLMVGDVLTLGYLKQQMADFFGDLESLPLCHWAWGFEAGSGSSCHVQSVLTSQEVRGSNPVHYIWWVIVPMVINWLMYQL